jgi:hypothetical protein
MDEMMESIHDNTYECDYENEQAGYHRERRPKYAHLTREVHMSFDADRLIQDETEQMYEAAYDHIPDEAITEMQAYLDGWIKQYGLTSYESISTRVKIPWSRFDAEHAEDEE